MHFLVLFYTDSDFTIKIGVYLTNCRCLTMKNATKTNWWWDDSWEVLTSSDRGWALRKPTRWMFLVQLTSPARQKIFRLSKMAMFSPLKWFVQLAVSLRFRALTIGGGIYCLRRNAVGYGLYQARPWRGVQVYACFSQLPRPASNLRITKSLTYHVDDLIDVYLIHL